MKKVDYMSVAEKVIDQIKRGAFLTVKAGDNLNTMTIGWAAIGYAWRRPVLMVLVRKTRHTFGIIEKAADFTVTAPMTYMREAITFCGSKSGRDVDKYKECGLKLADGQQTLSPVIKTPGIHLECRIVHKAAMDPAYLDQELQGLYPAKDYHTVYFGEILECYETA